MKILFIIPYPLGESPSQRFRFEQYFGTLKSKGYILHVEPFMGSQQWQLFYGRGKWIHKIGILMAGFYKRTLVLFDLAGYDFVFIHREACPVGPPLFEWIITKVLKKKTIYDFDDAIWLTDRKRESRWLQRVKWRSKIASICKWSYKVSCGNEYLCAYARQFNTNVFHNPTTIDTQLLHNPQQYTKIKRNKIIVGWTGSHSTLKYIMELEPVLQGIETKYPLVEFWVIADQPPELKLMNLHFKPWSLETEISDLVQFDIGLMPLPDDEWTKGKCGFKALQYMALQIPAIAAPVGVNKEIIQNGMNGLLCETPAEWKHQIIQLIENEALRNSIGLAARKTVIDRYSVSSNESNFIDFMK